MASRRQYLSQAELTQFADITIVDATEADDQISMAEELIDAYVGYQQKAFEQTITGQAAGGGSSTITLESIHQNIYDVDYFKLCEVEIIGGTGAGQRRVCTGSTKAGVLTVASAWDTVPVSGSSYYKIYQLGKFPRVKDAFFDGVHSPFIHYKSIPEAVKRAVAAQVEFVVEMGAAFFSGDQSSKQSESIGDYSYTNAEGAAGLAKLIAPKAKMLLRGIINRTGVIVV